jgi:hypothetical protein
VPPKETKERFSTLFALAQGPGEAMIELLDMAGRSRLVLSSFLMLFVELALIRWLGSNVIYLSYFSNFVLLGSFLGIGLGFLKGKSRTDYFPWAIVVLAFLVALVLLFPVTIARPRGDVFYFGAISSGIPMWAILPVVFLATATVMGTIAQGVARIFAQFEPLEAYRLDILGSLTGIVALSLLSYLGAPPLVWGAIASIVFLILYAPSVKALQVVAAVALLLMLGRESFQPGYTWSPYYKVKVFTLKPGTTVYDLNGAPYRVKNQFVAIDVNGINHQTIVSTAERRDIEPIYFVPYQSVRNNPLRDVLIVGAGNGKDVAIALASGAKHVDAVEIDPRIYQIGRSMNPDHPYQQPQVSIHIDDGRAFLERTRKKYDLILFALPDSLALISGQSSLRLETYLFTTESIRAAREHLTAGGAFGMYNYYREDWPVDRLANMLALTFGHPPCATSAGPQAHLALLMIGAASGNVACASLWSPQGRFVPAPVTDDRPFLYLRSSAIPQIYLITIGAILLASLLMVRLAAGSLRDMSGYLDLFFMGAAFLLLETKNVVQFALLFGTTWFVNALVFFGILLSVYAAIEVTRRARLPSPRWLYVALFASLAVAWAVKPELLLTLDIPLRLGAAIALAFAPIFLANLIFAERFRNVGSSTAAFAANLLGAMIGGVLEYASLFVGYRALLIVVAALYGLAFALRREPSDAPVSQASAQPT